MCVRQIGKPVHVWAHWRLAFALHLAASIGDPDLIQKGASPPQAHVQEVAKPYLRLLACIANEGVEDVYDLKNLIDAKDMARQLEIPLGPWIRDLMESKVIPWQLANPTATPDQCMAWVLSERPTILPFIQAEQQRIAEELIQVKKDKAEAKKALRLANRSEIKRKATSQDIKEN
jgi:hypothetical protein